MDRMSRSEQDRTSRNEQDRMSRSEQDRMSRSEQDSMSRGEQEGNERELRRLRRERLIAEQERQRKIEEGIQRLQMQRNEHLLEREKRRQLDLEVRTTSGSGHREETVKPVDSARQSYSAVEKRKTERGVAEQSVIDRDYVNRSESEMATSERMNNASLVQDRDTKEMHSGNKERRDLNVKILKKTQSELESELRRQVQLLKVQGVEFSPREERDLCNNVPKSDNDSDTDTDLKMNRTSNSGRSELVKSSGKVSWSDDIFSKEMDRNTETLSEDVFLEDEFGSSSRICEPRINESRYSSLPKGRRDYYGERRDLGTGSLATQEETRFSRESEHEIRHSDTDYDDTNVRNDNSRRNVFPEGSEGVNSRRSIRIRELEAELQRKKENMEETERYLINKEMIAKEREQERRDIERENVLKARIMEVDKRNMVLKERRIQLTQRDYTRVKTEEDVMLPQHMNTSAREREIDRKTIEYRRREQLLDDEEEKLQLSAHCEPDTSILRRRELQLEQWSKKLKEREDELHKKDTVSSDYTKFSTFSGEDPKPKGEATYEEWSYEVNCIVKERVHPEFKIAQAIRKSLKGQAKRVLIPLGTIATVDEMLTKLETIFGNVASGESVLQSFYTASQRADESVAAWGLRLEEILQIAINKGHVELAKKNSMLRSRFWRALRSEKLKNATRIYYETADDFEMLRREVRAEEHEIKLATGTAQHRPVQAQDQRDESKFDSMMKKITELERQMKEMNNQGRKKNKTEQQQTGKKNLN